MPRLILTIFAFAFTAQPVTAQTASAYLDSTAQQLVQGARARRQVADLSIERYRALSKERISVGLQGLRRDRLMYRREVAGRIEWAREGPARIEVLGARESVPIAMRGVKLPADLVSYMPHLAFDPADSRMLMAWDDDDFVRHPLAADAEAHYRFRAGSTTSIQLQDGRTIRLLELEIIPRRADPHLITGSFWLDAETHAVVQASFKLARKIDLLRDLEDEDDDDDIPGFLRGVTAELDYVTIDYGLYDLRWWMPRLMAFEGGVRMGPIRMPLLYERSYAEYEIEARAQPVTVTAAEIQRRDSISMEELKICRNRMTVEIGDKNERPDTTQTQQCGRWTVVLAGDTNRIINSALLPDNAFSGDEELLTDADLRQLRERLEDLGGPPMVLAAPEVRFSLIDPGMLRYNRIEGLSVGTSTSVDFGPYLFGAQARLGLADLEPNFEVSATRPGQDMSLSLAAYGRLVGTEPLRNPFSLGNSLSALLFGRDDAHFYRTLGIELRGEPAGAAGGRYWWRLYGQRERVAEVETDFSVRHLFDDDHGFRPNIVADEYDALGAEGVWRFQHGLNPNGFRFGADVYAHAAGGGDLQFGRGALTLRLGVPLPGRLDMALEGGAGTSVDSLPLQHNWYVGGSNTLRGYHAGSMMGASFWRGRGEIGYGLPAVRLVGFSDVAWAGARDEFATGQPLLSVGAGISILDGVLRFDVARGLRDPQGWAATIYFDGAL